MFLSFLEVAISQKSHQNDIVPLETPSGVYPGARHWKWTVYGHHLRHWQVGCKKRIG